MKIENIIVATCIGLIAAIVFGGIMYRYQMYSSRNGFSGGDAFNFLIAAESFKKLEYPKSERRLPVYPMVLMPFSGNKPNALFASKTIAFVSGALVVVAGSILVLMISRSVLATLFASVFTSLNVSLILSSARPLSDSFFNVLLVLLMFSVYFFWKTPTRRNTFLTGLLLGLASMTRFEGFAPLILFLAIFSPFKKYRSNILFTVLPIVLLFMAPWLIKNVYYFGNPFYTSYASVEEYGARTASEFIARIYDGFEGINTIFFYWNLDAVRVVKNILILPGIFSDKMDVIQQQHMEALLLSFFGLTVLISILIGSVWMIRKYTLYGIFLTLSVFGIFAMATWWTPRGRFFASQIALFSLLYGIGFALILEKIKKMKIAYVVYPLIVVMMFNYVSSQQKVISDRIISEAHDTLDSAAFIEMMKYISSQNIETYTNLDALSIIKYYSPDSQFAESLEDASLKTCTTDCYFLGEFEIDDATLTIDEGSFQKVISYYKPLTQTYYILYAKI